MRHKRVSDVMAREVVTVRTDTPFREVVQAMAEHDINGVPVLDDEGHVVGMVTETDLLDKQARAGGAANPTVWTLLRDKIFPYRGVATTAADVMSSPVITVAADARLTSAAAILARHNVKAAPVLGTGGELRGIVSRKDLLSVYLRQDSDLVDEIRSDVLARAMWVPTDEIAVEVSEGIVTLRGKVERQSMIDVITVLTAAVDGVVDVHNELTADVDDTHVPPPPPENVGILHGLTQP